jgi:peptidase E
MGEGTKFEIALGSRVYVTGGETEAIVTAMKRQDAATPLRRLRSAEELG